MRFFELIKDTLGMKAGQSFMQTPDGMYVNSTNSCRLNSAMVENNDEYFKETEAPNIWKPGQDGEAFWTVTPDGGTIELPWDEMKFGRLWQFGNVFRDKDHAEEVAQAIAVIIPTYQKKFNEFITKHPKEAKILQQQVQQATPPVQQMGVVPQNIQMPPQMQPPPSPMPPPPMQPQRNIVNDPRFSPFNKFTQPGMER